MFIVKQADVTAGGKLRGDDNTVYDSIESATTRAGQVSNKNGFEYLVFKAVRSVKPKLDVEIKDL
jgi:hypothetical protein